MTPPGTPPKTKSTDSVENGDVTVVDIEDDSTFAIRKNDGKKHVHFSEETITVMIPNPPKGFCDSIPNKEINYNNATHFNDKQKKRKIESNIVNHVSKKNLKLNKLELCMNKKCKSSKQIQNVFKVKKRESGYFKTGQVPTTSVWDFGGTWSSNLAGVRFVVDSHSTVGIDNSIPVKILDMAVGTKSNGFLNKGWMAKANAQYGHLGPVSLSAINREDKNVAVFIGFINSQNNKDVVTGMWSMGRNCKNNLDTHQSVFNIPDVLYKDSNEQGD